MFFFFKQIQHKNTKNLSAGIQADNHEKKKAVVNETATCDVVFASSRKKIAPASKSRRGWNVLG